MEGVAAVHGVAQGTGRYAKHIHAKEAHLRHEEERYGVAGPSQVAHLTLAAAITHKTPYH